jgi:hypothetical protein
MLAAILAAVVVYEHLRFGELRTRLRAQLH